MHASLSMGHDLEELGAGSIVFRAMGFKDFVKGFLVKGSLGARPHLSSSKLYLSKVDLSMM